MLTLPGLLERIRRSGRWWVVAPALAAVAGVGLAFLQPPRYTATESILLAEAPSYLPTSVSGVRPPRETTVDTEAALVMAERTMQRVVDAGAGSSTTDLRRSVRVTAVPNTRVLVIEATGAAAGRPTTGRSTWRGPTWPPGGTTWRSAATSTSSACGAAGAADHRRGPQGRYLSHDQRQDLAGLGEAVTNILLTPTDAGELLRHRDPVEIAKPYASRPRPRWGSASCSPPS